MIVIRTCYYVMTAPNGETIYDKHSFERHVKQNLSPLLDVDMGFMRKKYPDCQVQRTTEEDYTLHVKK